MLFEKSTQLSLTIFFIFCLGPCLISQTDTLQQVNARGKKHGYWRQFLDSNAMATDSANAYFIAFEYYHNGKNSFDFYHEKWKNKDSAVFVGDYSNKGQPKILNGKFTWYDKESQMITYEELYEKGHPIKFKAIRYKKKGKNYTWAFIRTFDFMKLYHNVPGSFYIMEQNNQSIYKLEEWAYLWFRDGNRGWKEYRINKEK